MSRQPLTGMRRYYVTGGTVSRLELQAAVVEQLDKFERAMALFLAFFRDTVDDDGYLNREWVTEVARRSETMTEEFRRYVMD